MRREAKRSICVTAKCRPTRRMSLTSVCCLTARCLIRWGAAGGRRSGCSGRPSTRDSRVGGSDGADSEWNDRYFWDVIFRNYASEDGRMG